jgi:hypothetical protein
MIESIAHKGTTLHVKYKGGATYEYQNVTADQFHTLKHAESVGRHLNGMKIKGVKL